MTGCPWCADACVGHDLEPLLAPDLCWLWKQAAKAADVRGDPDLCTGKLRVTAPDRPEQRAAAVGLVGGQLRPGQQRTVELAALTAKLQATRPGLTPGAVAAHAVGRRLATRAAEKSLLEQRKRELREQLLGGLADLPGHVAELVGPDEVWDRLTQTGALTRLLGRADSSTLLRDALAVLAALPEADSRADRRRLVPGAPHALDDGTPLASLVLALAGQSGRRTRQAWHALGVDIDDLTGGLLTLGMHPNGWQVPVGAALTLPPRELVGVSWPPAEDAGWVFVVENPSVVAAAIDRLRAGSVPQGGGVRLLCTVGTPSGVEAAAIAAADRAGWQVAVRADFDEAGLFHVRMLLDACPSALPWRMDDTTYRSAADSLPAGRGLTVTSADSPWEPGLALSMASTGVPVFEEDVLDLLLDDLFDGRPADVGFGIATR